MVCHIHCPSVCLSISFEQHNNEECAKDQFQEHCAFTCTRCITSTFSGVWVYQHGIAWLTSNSCSLPVVPTQRASEYVCWHLPGRRGTQEEQEFHEGYRMSTKTSPRFARLARAVHHASVTEISIHLARQFDFRWSQYLHTQLHTPTSTSHTGH